MPTFVFTSPEGKKYKINGPNEQGARSALQNHLSKTAAPPKPTIDQSTDGPMEGFGAAFRYGIDAPLENMGETAEALGAEGTAAALRGATEAPEGYVSAASQFMNDPEGGFGWRYLPKATVEQAGQFAGSIASRAAGAAAGGAVGGPVGAIAGGLSAPALFEITQQLGPIANERAKNSGRDKPNAEDWMWASTSATGMGVLNAIAPNASGLFKRMLIEGGTEAVQSGIEQGGSTASTDKGLTIDPRQMAGEGILGGTSAGMVDTTIAAGKKTGKLFTSKGKFDPQGLSSTEAQANADVARLLRSISDSNNYSLKDIDVNSKKGAKQTLEAAHEQISNALKDITKNPAVKQFLDPKQAKDLDDLIDNYSAAQVAIRQGSNKVKSQVTQENYDAIMRLLPPTKEAAEIANLLRMSNSVTDLFANGMKGGVSQYTDYFNPFIKDGSYDPSRMANVFTGIGSAAVLGPQTTVPLYLGGRAIDKVTGRRFSVNRFINKNETKGGLPTAEGPSLIALRNLQEQQEALLQEQETEATAQRTEAETQEREQLNLELAQQNAPPTPTSPQETMETATGLDRNGVARILRIIEATNANPALQRAIKDYRNSIARGGRIEDNMISPLIRAVKQQLASEPRLDALRVREPEAGTQPQQQQQQTSGRMFTSAENYQAGIEANQQMIQELSDQANQDNSLRLVHRKLITDALDALGRNLGPNSEAAAAAIVDHLINRGNVPQAAIDQYVQPYVDRVVGQQQAKQSMVDRGATRLSEEPPSSFTGDNTPVLRDVVPEGQNTGVPMETSIDRARAMAKSKRYQKGRELKVDLQKKALASQKAAKIDLTELSDENVDRLADFALYEALEALKTNSNAIGWYEQILNKALDTISVVYPEIKTNPENRLQFIWALAVMSNGAKVDKNLELAANVYEHLQANGRFPTNVGIGKAAKAMNEGLAMYHTMLDRFNGDHAALEKFMLTEMTARDLQSKYDVTVGGESPSTVVRGASIIGPKIGNGFFANLYGHYDALTMDRWFMRTVGRWRGTLIKINKPMIKTKRNQLWSVLSSMDKDQISRLKNLYKGTRTKISNKVMSDKSLDKLAEATAKLSQSPAWRELINQEFQDVRLIGNALTGYLDGQVEIPSGPVERTFLRKIFGQALERLNSHPNLQGVSNRPLTMADLQALLWYPEKVLYETAKKPVGQEIEGYVDEEAPDYANAAQKFVDNRRTNSRRNRLGPASRVGGSGRRLTNDAALTKASEEPILTRATFGQLSSNNLRENGRLQEEGATGLGSLALESQAGNPQDVTSLEGLNDPDVLDDFLKRPNWAVVTATQEDLPDSIKERRNKENNEYLEQQLKDKGIPYLLVSGAYKGVDQGTSFLIIADEPTAMTLGKRHLQESILTNKGLVYTRRPQPPTKATGENLFGKEAASQDFYSTVSGLPFSMGLDFSTGPSNAVFKSGYTEAANRPQLPVRQSDGLVELHHWSDRQLNTIDPAFAGTGPYQGAERKRGASLSFFGINPRETLRDQGTGYVKELNLGRYEHISLVDPNELYPIFEDPDNLLVDVGSDIGAAEDAIRNAGYKGYYTTDDGSGQAPLGNVAALFEPIEVSEGRGLSGLSPDQGQSGNPRGALFNAEENPQGVAGTLAQRMLQQPDDQNQLATRPPTIQEAASQKEAVKALFEIGKKGSKYENGIQSIEDARKLAKALGQFINLYSDQQKMLKDIGLSSDRTGVRGMFTKDYQRGGSTGQVFGLKAGTQVEGETITDFGSLATFLHEVSHGLAMGPSSSERGVLYESDLVDGKNKLKTRDKTEDTIRGSWESALLPLLAKANGTVVKEIQNLQHNIEVYSEKNPNDRRAVRLIADLKQEYADHEARVRVLAANETQVKDLLRDHKRHVDQHSNYVQSLSEFAVDPIWVYLANPRLAKVVMPKTTKMIRENFRAAKNPNVQFYAHPLAMGVAIMLAIMAQQEAADDEEEQQQQMPAGALSPQMGILSAA